MTRVHVQTAGFASPNGCAFLFPLLVHRRALAEAGITLAFHKPGAEPAALADCDVLVVENKVYGARWLSESERILEILAALRERAGRLLYVDITDSSGWDHARALPVVDTYVKSQLLRDRGHYLRPLAGHRLYAEHYRLTQGVADADGAFSESVPDAALLDKLRVGWNSGLADYSLRGPLRMALYRRLPLPWLLRYPADSVDPARDRPLDVACRIGTGYHRETVAWQRKAMAERLAARLSTDKLSRRAYLAEMARARIVVSPFGLGEITLRDFEIFMAGALALKPSMAHMETWPDLFRDGETIASHDWDLEDLEETIDGLLADPARCEAIARAGQQAYLRHTAGPDAAALFVAHFESLLAP